MDLDSKDKNDLFVHDRYRFNVPYQVAQKGIEVVETWGIHRQNYLDYGEMVSGYLDDLGVSGLKENKKLNHFPPSGPINTEPELDHDMINRLEKQTQRKMRMIRELRSIHTRQQSERDMYEALEQPTTNL